MELQMNFARMENGSEVKKRRVYCGIDKVQARRDKYILKKGLETRTALNGLFKIAKSLKWRDRSSPRKSDEEAIISPTWRYHLLSQNVSQKKARPRCRGGYQHQATGVFLRDNDALPL
jgi:hypothetical protein